MPENRDQKSSGKSAGRNEVTSGGGGDAIHRISGEDHSSAGEQGATGDLDLEGLDLTVETVEERISPSETNVFDK